MIVTPLFVFFLVIVFVVVWLFINTIDKRKWLTLIVSLALTPIVYFYLFYPMLNIFSSYHHEKYFDAEAWKKKPAFRYEMAKYVKSELLTEKSKEDVELLLGEPEWFGWNDSIKANSPELWNYNLGFKPGALNNMQECVEIEFKKNIVTTIKQYQLEKTFE